MGTLTIRNLDDTLKRRLQRRAAVRGISMEQQARELIAKAVRGPGRMLSVDEILALGIKPNKDFDQKRISDELYTFLENE
jgi:plasmid stability protein